MPADKPWLIYHEWSKTYGKSFFAINVSFKLLHFLAGDMVCFQVLGQPFLVLDILRRTNDLQGPPTIPIECEC